MVRRRKRAPEASEPPPEEPGAPEPAPQSPVEPPAELRRSNRRPSCCRSNRRPSRPPSCLPSRPPSRPSPSTPARMSPNRRPAADAARPGRLPTTWPAAGATCSPSASPGRGPPPRCHSPWPLTTPGVGSAPPSSWAPSTSLARSTCSINGVDPSAVPAERARSTRFAIAVTNLPLLAVLVAARRGGGRPRPARDGRHGPRLLRAADPDPVRGRSWIRSRAPCSSSCPPCAGPSWPALRSRTCPGRRSSPSRPGRSRRRRSAPSRTSPPTGQPGGRSIATALGRRQTAAISLVGYAVAAVALACCSDPSA